MESPAAVSDSNYYIAMAEGRWDQVAAPWGYRIGLPWLAAHLSRWTHLSTTGAFFVLAIIFTAVLIGALSFLLADSWRILPLLFFTPLAMGLVHGYFLPDLMQAALIAIFLVLLNLEWWAAAALLLFPMMLVRESAVLLAAVAILIIRNRRWGMIAAAATVGGLIASHLAVPQLANVHGISGILYLALKVPFNGLKNLAGIVLIPNTLRGQPGYTCAAAVTFRLHLGLVHDVGVCHPEVTLPLTTLAIMLTIFGTGPLMFWTSSPTRPQTWLRVAMLYGLISFALAPFLGSSVDRLAGYGWPLFWLYLPRGDHSLRDWGLYSMVSWLPFVVDLDDHPERAFYVVVGAILLYSVAALSARRTIRSRPVHSAARF